MNDFFQLSGWIVALLSLIVNVLQLIQNKALKKKIAINQSIGENANNNTVQSHTGTGHNVKATGDVNLK